jgi:hypothetical protein
MRYQGANVNSHAVTLSNWQFGGGFTVNGRGLADRLTRGGPSGYTTLTMSPWAYLNSDNRKPIMFSLNVSGSADQFDSNGWNVSPSLTWRPMRALSIGAGFGINHNLNQQQWIVNLVDPAGPHYVFGRLDQTTVSVTARVNYTLTPTLSLQVYLQPFVSAGDYTDFKELVDGRALDYHLRYSPFAYTGNPDFNVRSFRTTNVLRWEYRPGSAMFIVWQQGREGFLPQGDFVFESRLRPCPDRRRDQSFPYQNQPLVQLVRNRHRVSVSGSEQSETDTRCRISHNAIVIGVTNQSRFTAPRLGQLTHSRGCMAGTNSAICRSTGSSPIGRELTCHDPSLS